MRRRSMSISYAATATNPSSIQSQLHVRTHSVGNASGPRSTTVPQCVQSLAVANLSQSKIWLQKVPASGSCSIVFSSSVIDVSKQIFNAALLMITSIIIVQKRLFNVQLLISNVRGRDQLINSNNTKSRVSMNKIDLCFLDCTPKLKIWKIFATNYRFKMTTFEQKINVLTNVVIDTRFRSMNVATDSKRKSITWTRWSGGWYSHYAVREISY